MFFISYNITYSYASDTEPVWPEDGPEGPKHVAVKKKNKTKGVVKDGIKKSKAVPLHAMVAYGGRGGIAPTHT
jgi:hypothetical protein